MAPLDYTMIENQRPEYNSSQEIDVGTIPKLSFDGLLSHETNKGNQSQTKLPFAWKLYEMLEGVEQSGDGHIVSWVESGKAFRVHDLSSFVQRIVPIYFNQSKYKSFQRQLNLYGFSRISRGENNGAYFHANFQRGKKADCLSFRPKTSKSRKRAVQKHAAKEEKTGDNRSYSSLSWKQQLEILLAKGAAHIMDLVETEEAEQERTATRMRQQVNLVPEPKNAQEYSRSRIQEGDAVCVFDNMPFHFLGEVYGLRGDSIL
jgi:hypothetical protein